MKTQGSPGGSPPCPIYLSLPQEIQPTALNYIDGYRSERLPANMLQAQRDYFGAHSYGRVDMSRLEFFHANWSARGGCRIFKLRSIAGKIVR